ncbi:hypothetical protein [Brytella acorum]|uniref:Uncharacterized protein n=1 Tax=Brytella acorum TaxID=2959299 RepID=A0AA35XVQ0_9PROT|nr:hypothetical protein [Brytella acorum]MDF3623608.1 hypothetical protein [Brytella acorum]CAI9119974.1 hypothetical protein LMG32879_000800 [Brytella acorum]
MDTHSLLNQIGYSAKHPLSITARMPLLTRSGADKSKQAGEQRRACVKARESATGLTQRGETCEHDASYNPIRGLVARADGIFFTHTIHTGT